MQCQVEDVKVSAINSGLTIDSVQIDKIIEGLFISDVIVTAIGCNK